MRKQKSHARHTAAFLLPLILLASWFALPARYRRALEPTAFAAATTFTVNVTGDGADANAGDGTCATSSGNCSLRAAIQEANANAGKDTINFNIPGAGVHTITPAPPGLDDITGSVIIDGYSQPGASQNTLANGDNAVLLIELNGINAPASGLNVTAGNSTIQGLVINRFPGGGISLGTNGGNTIQGNFIGTNAAGTAALGNKFSGVAINNGNNNTIGGTTAAARNVISGTVTNTFSVPAGIAIFSSGNKVQGNFIGTDSSGTVALGNESSGVRLFAAGSNNTIGGTTAGARNIISGNNGAGVDISNTSNTLVQGNYVGTDVNGTTALPNTESGVLIVPSTGNSDNNLIGGTTAAARNVLSGNGQHGVEIGEASNNQVQGNFIGTDASGVAGLGNTLSGLFIHGGASNNTIGGAIGLRNIIAFNGIRGVDIADSQITGNAILTNSIYSNGDLGIDLGSDSVTPNDPLDSDTGPNNLQNFPGITSAINNGSSTTVSGSLDSSPNASFTVQLFANPSCDVSGNGEGQTFVGSINMTTGVDGHLMFSTLTLTPVPAGQFITATATDSTNNTSEFSQCVQVTGATPSPTPTPGPTPNTFQFGQSTYSIFEDCAVLTVSVSRIGDSSTSATVDYATQLGTASERTDYTTALGTLQFAPGETAKSFDVLISEDSFTEGTETASIGLSNPSGATLGSPATATLEILDDPPEPAINTIDVAEGFVCQHYHDFLNREDDTSGLAFWTNEIESCGNNAACILSKRVSVSGAFFLSIEFQETGGFAIRVQRVAFGKKSEEAATRISYNQFIRDARQVGDGVVVGQPGFDIRLGANEQTYATQVVTSAAFINSYPLAQTADQYVDALFASAGVTPTTAERQAAIDAFGGGGTAGRTAALRSVSDSNSVGLAEFTPSFVLMQYYGYLRRNPTDAPDNNDNGYQFWLTKLNQFNGDFRRAEMVKAFITSTEYRSRFGQP